MPIPGPSTSLPAEYDAIPTGSPFALSVHGVWYQLEGVVPGVAVGSERARSSVTTEGGRRFEQRARLARRSWDVSLPYASAANLAALRVAADSDDDVWLMSDAVAQANMLGNRDGWGTSATLVDCEGLSLPSFTTDAVVRGRVRGGVPTTLSVWSPTALTSADLVAEFDYPGFASMGLWGNAEGRPSFTFTPTADGEIVITFTGDFPAAGLMLTEGDPPAVFIPGESMPCKVVVDDPGDVLTMFHGGAWRHDFSVQLREVG